jgi:hypothetical protein
LSATLTSSFRLPLTVTDTLEGEAAPIYQFFAKGGRDLRRGQMRGGVNNIWKLQGNLNSDDGR